MQQRFDRGLNAVITTNDAEQVRSVLFRPRPREIEADSPLGATAIVIRELGERLEVDPGQLANIARPPDELPTDAGVEIRFLEEKRQQDTITVGLYQTCFGLPVFEAGLAVTMKSEPYRVIRVQSTLHRKISPRLPSADAVRRFRELPVTELRRVLNLDAALKPARGLEIAMFDGRTVRIRNTRFMIYRYDAERRFDNERKRPNDRPQPFEGPRYTLPLPPVSTNIQDGTHYVVAELLFSLGTSSGKIVNWQALVDVETSSVLRLRALVDTATGQVFKSDPSTQDPTASPSQPAATLDTYRTSETLPDVNTPAGADPWTLDGTLVAISDFEVPTIAPPEEATDTFDYTSRTDNFAAVSAYYHCDRFFRIVEDLGFTLASYFDNTSFPIQVDHRGHFGTADGIEVNAYCSGNAMSNGIGNVACMLADLTDLANPLGAATDWRLILHELAGHGILWDHVDSANFGFAHSAGDGMAAILNDPDTAATDRFETFPFIIQSVGLGLRRHDRDVAAGWAWGGSQDDGVYGSEQILATSHFRIYRSIGGDASSLSKREFASRFTAYLILSAVGTLTPATNPPDAADYADALMAADAADWVSEGHAGGAYSKVIRWAFEKQGLYQPGSATPPFTTEGDPPEVDVYIDDGRAGEYPYQPVHWANTSVWNRLAPDALPGHEEPILGATNYVYVTVRNRGTQTATGIVVRGFHTDPGAGLTWPDDFQAMTTASLPVPDIPSGGVETVGPFEWTPSHLEHECILMIADATDDPSNADLFTGGTDSIPEWRLVPHDNNIAQRNVSPVEGDDGEGFKASLERKTFTVKNTFRNAAEVVLETTLPPLLTERGWRLTFANLDDGRFRLGPGEKREIRMSLIPGKDFRAEDVKRENELPRIDIRVVIGGIPVGGMSFAIDPNHQDDPTKRRRATY